MPVLLKKKTTRNNGVWAPTSARHRTASSSTQRRISVVCFPMLNIPQLAQIKARDPYLYESLKQIVGAVNSIGRATGVDPSGSMAGPATIGSISVTGADGIFDIAITDNSAVRRGIFYFAESDTDPAFTQPQVYFLGSSRN